MKFRKIVCPCCEKLFEALNHKTYCSEACRIKYRKLHMKREEDFRLTDEDYSIYCRIHGIKNKRLKQ